MQAIQLKQPREFQRIEIPEPAHPGPGEALVRVHRVGICGTDIAGYLGKMPFYSYPRIPGHELGVEVLADIRYLPLSRRPGFSKNSLKAGVEEAKYWQWRHELARDHVEASGAESSPLAPQVDQAPAARVGQSALSRTAAPRPNSRPSRGASTCPRCRP